VLLARESAQTVAVRGGTVTLPFLSYRRTQTIQGDPGIQLAGYLSDTVSVPAATLAASQANFTLPPALRTAPAGSVYTGGYTEPVPRGQR
jgi:hypothetical protein